MRTLPHNTTHFGIILPTAVESTQIEFTIKQESRIAHFSSNTISSKKVVTLGFRGSGNSRRFLLFEIF